MVLDVRIHGGSTPPKLSFTGSIKRIIPDLNLGMIVYPNDTILPELMDDKLITEYGSITIKNGFLPLPLSQRPQIAKYDVNTERGWKQVIRVVAKDSSGQELRINSKTMYTIMLAPGQVFAVPFKFIGVPKNFDGTISLELLLYDNDQEEIFTISVGTFILNRHTWGVESYRITFDGFDNAIQEGDAGVDINDNNFWTDAVNRQEYAWIIFATGRTPWGFDWHGPSYKNIDASIDALRFAPGVPESLKMDYLPQIERLIFVGHSNGGHGAWWCASHYPDRTLAVIPASGYTKIQLYVPYFLHLGYAYTDPIMRGIMESSISENDLDLYAANLGGIPILARSGGDDDNVPAYHTRRLFRMINEWNGKLNSIRYVEDPGKGHWYTGILNDNIATHFLNDIIHPNINPKLSLPKLPNPFTVATLNPASSGTRGGIRILQLEVPFKFATIKVHRIHNNHWELTTSNVRRFGFVKDSRQGDITTWSIDGTQFLTPPEEAGPSYLKTEEGWELASDLLWISRERNPTTYGPISLIFSEPFRIVIPTAPTSDIYLYRKLARQIAQNWYIAGRGSTQIIKDIDVLDGISAKYNLIVLGDPRDNYYTLRRTQGGASKLISFTPNGGIKIGGNTFDQPGTGALFLAPSQARTRLCLFVTGVDESGLLRAAWSIPFQTGLQVADYLIVGNEYGDPSTGWTADGIVEGGTKGAGNA
ncbi:hypothetical protein HDV02_004885 [Globomyces sp. JEL0801]|nr:hypothetical protein HDV02_004885 [Globomyces sp. JEL0801]